MIRLSDGASADGYSLVLLQSVDSTNRLALDLAQQAGANRTWVLSETQREGRGRHGRAWASPPGNLYASLLLVSPCLPADAPKLGFVAGIALAETLREVGLGGDVRLKWPNDVLVDGAKLAGILLEGRMIGPDKQAIAIGMGVNILIAPDVPDRATASLASLGCHARLEDVFRTLSERMAAGMRMFQRGAGFFAVREHWNRLALPVGTAMSVRQSAGSRQGQFAGIDGEGRLLLRTDDGMVTIDAGDVDLTSR